jgi:ABC-2 type transport system ATP-binding protein
MTLMQITLTNTGKRYNREWIFRHLDYEFIPGRTYAVTGPNGSGKSTLLQVIAGAIQHSEGEIKYNDTGNTIPVEHNPVSATDSYKQISIAAPYLELIEEMTANELLGFHSTFKKLTRTVPEILTELSLLHAANKQIRYFSSGMKQRLKLAQAFFSSSKVLFLDEPTTNLDSDGIELYHQLIGKYASGKLVIVSSNDKQEYSFCEEVISISSYK